jgi:LacI family transcriptional regulator
MVATRRTTIHELAKTAGVSAPTVSRALNGQKGVGLETRERIVALAKQHGFTPNAMARQLAIGKSNSIGVVTPFRTSELITSSPVHVGLLSGFGDVAEAGGYDLLLLNIASSKAISRLTDAVQRGRVDGVVLPAAAPNDQLLRALTGLDFPTVVIGHRTRATGVPWADSSHDVACYELTRVMIAAGRQRVAFVTDPLNRVSALGLRAKGFRQAVSDCRAQVETASEVVVSSNPVTARGQIRELIMGKSCPPPNAIVAARDRLAYVCLEIARELDIQVPGSLAISGFDDLELSDHTSPPLTTVRMPVHELGFAAGEMLFALIEGREPPNSHVVLPTQLVIRKSTPPEANIQVGDPIMTLSLDEASARFARQHD